MTEPTTITLDSLSASKCENCEVKLLEPGQVELKEQLPGTGNGEVAMTAKITTLCHYGLYGTVHCIYGANRSGVAHLTGGSLATLELEAQLSLAVTAEETPQSALCYPEAIWDDRYQIKSPTALYVTEHT